MQRILQVTAMLLVLPFTLVGCKRSDEAVFLQYFNLAVREFDREIAMLKKRDSKYTEMVIHKLDGDIRHLQFKMIVFHNKPQLHKELDARRGQLYEMRIAIMNKDIDRDIAMLKGRELGLDERAIQKLRGEIRHLYSKTLDRPDLHKELDTKRTELIETRIASLKNKDNELPR
jgi:chaperonin cofactor prefoldin